MLLSAAAIGVTRGALQQLNRRELQGVIAHEFAHIRNGDMRVKTRIIGWVYGIAIITVLGRILLHQLWWAPRRRDNENNAAMVMLAVGIGLVAIGAVGTLFARMVQAAVSRQREYLADASAVQYTRDPSGIGDALIKIGAMGRDNRVRAAHATEAGHLLFSTAEGRSMATHPPLNDRIKRLLPDWDGSFPDPVALEAEREARIGRSRQGRASSPGSGQSARPQGGVLPGQVAIPGMPNLGLPVDPVIIAGLDGQARQPGQPRPTAHPKSTGQTQPPPPQPAGRPANGFSAPSFTGPSDAHIEHARELLAMIPEPTQNFLHTRQGAVAAVIGLLVSSDEASRPAQLARAGAELNLDPDYLDAAGKVISDLHRSLQLPAVDIALHSIHELPYEFKLTLAATIEDIESNRPDQDLFRWMLRRVMLRHLEDQHDDGSAVHNRSLNELRQEAATVLAIVAWFNSSGGDQAQSAYDAALAAIGSPAAGIPPVQQLTFDRLDQALDRLSDLDQPGREAFVNGATAAVLHDGKTTVEEAELIRVVADAVRLPVPPLLPA
ncbi:MAG: M48 family metalloprotease [Actinomycetota bacterium]